MQVLEDQIRLLEDFLREPLAEQKDKDRAKKELDKLKKQKKPTLTEDIF